MSHSPVEMISTIALLICSTGATQPIDWGTTCSYTEEPWSASVTLYLDEEEYLSTIPAGKDKVFIDLTANADLDTKLVAADGTVLLEYRRWYGWTGGCVSCAGSQTFTYHGMNFETCVDKCQANKTFTYRSGKDYDLTGSADYAEEWVFIDSTTEDLTLSVIGYEPGSGTIEWLWDCPLSCSVCQAQTMAPFPAPTQLPVPLPTRNPIPSPTQSPIPSPTQSPVPAPTKQPVLAPTRSPVPAPSSPDGGSCFHGNSTVLLESGKSKPLMELAVGDNIKTSDGEGHFSFSPVVKLPHKRNTEPAAFLALLTEAGKIVEMTSDHLIPKCNQEVVTAGELLVGDCLLTVDGKETLVKITWTEMRGVYTAITKDKFIVVDGIIASPHSKNADPDNPTHDYEKYMTELEEERQGKLAYLS